MTVADTIHGHFPPEVLREYALLADGERGAVVGPRGDIVWMCAPRWDSDAVFTALIGGPAGYAVTPAGRYVWGGYYEEGSMIWRSRWVTDHGIVECREALAFPGDPHRAVLLRRVLAVDAPRTVADHPATPRPVTAATAHRPAPVRRHLDRPHRRRCTCGGAAAGDARPGAARPRCTSSCSSTAGEQHDLVLEISDRAAARHARRPGRRLARHRTAWQRAVPTLDTCLDPRDARRSYAVLRGLTRAGGGMVAAATTSLPERAEAGRNYDYRYVWIRDQCYAGQAVAAAGPHPLLDDAVRFVAARLLEHGDRARARLHHHRRRRCPTSGTSTCPATRAAPTSSATGSTSSSSSTRSARRCCCSPPPPATTGSTPTLAAPPKPPPPRSPAAGPNPTPGSGRSTTGPGRTAG